MVYSTMDVGLGRNGFSTLAGNMSLKCSYKDYLKHQAMVIENVQTKVKQVMKRSVEAAKHHYAADEDGIYNVRVIFDGPWQKRGHTSLLGVEAVIEAETGCVLDYKVLSKFCEACTKRENILKSGKISKRDFDQWKSNHESECLKKTTKALLVKWKLQQR
ncbi:hypothetical protein E2C01_060104 [Portunus trituberculatus]|uniref:Mutator-like transposase domain-containing protein n=1 Tax=Portunus trituberculatus TaxID=210409 RepID=A0A5B7H770_PORTR|nr:hypothetical protein [Portunus trituberculatus]